MLRAGRLRNRVTIQTRASTLSTRGLPANSWSDTTSVWAEIVTLSGAELVQARQLYATATNKIVIRDPNALVTLTTKLRVKFGTRYFNIGHIDRNDQSGEFVTLICGEEVA